MARTTRSVLQLETAADGQHVHVAAEPVGKPNLVLEQQLSRPTVLVEKGSRFPVVVNNHAGRGAHRAARVLFPFAEPRGPVGWWLARRPPKLVRLLRLALRACGH